jgi:hypothetical protein
MCEDSVCSLWSSDVLYLTILYQAQAAINNSPALPSTGYEIYANSNVIMCFENIILRSNMASLIFSCPLIMLSVINFNEKLPVIIPNNNTRRFVILVSFRTTIMLTIITLCFEDASHQNSKALFGAVAA